MHSRYSHICLLLITIALGSVLAQAQNTLQGYDLYTTRSGLTHNHVLAMAQDEHGYLWVGTRNGLNRFDGQEFISYTGIPDSSGNSVINAIDALFCSKDKVWIGSRIGTIACLNTKNGDWQLVYVPDEVTSNRFGIKCIYVSDEGVLYAGTSNGCLITANTLTGKQRVERVCTNEIRSITTLNNELLIYADKIYRYTKEGIEPLPVRISLSAWPSSAINGNMLLLNEAETNYYFYDLDSGRVIATSEKETGAGQTIVRASANGFIAANTNTIRVYNLHGKLRGLYHLDENESRDRWELINNVMEDRQGNIWVAIDHGLAKIVPARYRFTAFNTNNRFRKISHNYIRSLYAEGNTVWAGTWHGYMNKLELTPSGTYKITPYFFTRDTKESTINAITRLASGTLLAGGQEGLFRLKGGVFEPFLFTHQTLYGDVWMIRQDKHGWIWISTQQKEGNRLYILDEKMRVLNTFIHPVMIWNMLEDWKGNIWLATENGLECAEVNRATHNIRFINHRHFARNAPGGLRMWSLYEDSEHNIWIGTTDHGLVCYRPASADFVSYSEKDGLPGNTVSSLAAGSQPDKLWISTTNGLAMMHLPSHDFTCYTEEEGIISNDFNFKACAATSRGELFWGTKMGIMSFYPDSLKAHYRNAPLVFTAVSIMGKAVIPDDTITLNYGQNMITVKFALLDYRHNRHNYRYRLKGFHPDWNDATEKNPFATYTSLTPGIYELEVHAFAPGNKQTGSANHLFIIVKPAFWQTTWFMFASFLLFVSLLGSVVYYRIRYVISNEREKQTISQKISELELSALQAQMNPHFIFNAIHSIQHFIVKNDVMNANEYLSKFAGLMRLFLESSKQKFISLADELAILRLYTDLEKLRFEEKFDVVIITDPALDLNATEIPSMLLQPFVENAIIHGLIYKKEKGHLLIKISKLPNGIRCIIDDDGIGRKASLQAKRKHHSSRGMELILDRVNSYNKLHGIPFCSISVIDKNNLRDGITGTRVEILIIIV